MQMIAALAAAFVAFMTAHGDVKPPRPRPATWELADAKSHPRLPVVKKRTINGEPPAMEAASHRPATRVALGLRACVSKDIAATCAHPSRHSDGQSHH